MNFRRRAEEWAREILAGQRSVGYRTDLIKERLRSQKRLQRQLYQATFRIWEPAGLAEVDVDPKARVAIRIRYPVAAVDVEALGGWGEDVGPWIGPTIADVARAHEGSKIGVREIRRARAPRGDTRALLSH